MKKRHLLVLHTTIACHRALTAGTWTTANIHDVSCLNCRDTAAYEEQAFNVKQAQEAAYEAQEPHTVVPQFGRVNADGVMDCYHCGGVLWKERPRSLFSFHYVCQGCGKSCHPPTETGMCT